MKRIGLEGHYRVHAHLSRYSSKLCQHDARTLEHPSILSHGSNSFLLSSHLVELEESFESHQCGMQLESILKERNVSCIPYSRNYFHIMQEESSIKLNRKK